MADQNILQSNLQYTRRGGSGFTVFVFGGVPVAFAQQVSHQAPRFVNNPSFIQPMDEPYVVEILTPVAASVGTLVLNLYDLWSNEQSSQSIVSKIWDRLGAGGNGDGTGGSANTIPGRSSGQGYTGLSGGGIFAGASDIVDVAIAQAQATPSQMSIVQYIRQIPNMQSGSIGVGNTTTGINGNSGYVHYHGCTITDVRDDETVQIGTLEVVKQITVNYTYSTRSGANNTNWAIALRNGA
jgi:hypothetical protein